ncbi:MAG: 2-oxoacid:acceptor oxidoreductase family protein [Patescibacteria group bacterium]
MTTATLPKDYSFYFTGFSRRGVRTATQILVEAALVEGCYIQLFDDNYVNKNDNEEVIWAKISSSPFKDRSRPGKFNGAVFLEPSLLGNPQIINPLSSADWLLLNTKISRRELAKTFKSPLVTYPFDASEIARYFMEDNFPGLVLLGGLLKIIPVVELSTIETVIRGIFKDRWETELLEKNIIALRMGFNEFSL